jgi:hypothetical protein
MKNDIDRLIDRFADEFMGEVDVNPEHDINWLEVRVALRSAFCSGALRMLLHILRTEKEKK